MRRTAARRELPPPRPWHGLLFLLFSSLVTLPLVFRMKAVVWGSFGKGDLQMWFWYYWWEKKLASFFWLESQRGGGGLLAQLNAFLGRFLSIPFYYNDTGNILDRTIVTPLFEALLPFPLYHNVKALLLFSLAGLGAYLLVRRLVEDEFSPWLAGVVFAFSPYALFEMAMGRPMQTWIFVIPFYLLFLLRAMGEGRWGLWLGAGLMLGLASITYWYYGVFLVILTAILALHGIFTRKGAPFPVRGFLLLAAVMAVVCGPFLLPAYWKMTEVGGIPGVALFTPFPSFRDLAGGAYNRFQYWVVQESCSLDLFFQPRGDFFSPHVPYVLLALAAGSALLLGRRAWLWLGAGVFFWSLALGPYLKIGGRLVGWEQGFLVPLPYQLFYRFFPLFSRFQWPSRFMVVVYLCMAIVACLGLKLVFRENRVGRAAQAWAVCALGAAFLLELLVRGMLPVPLTPVELPAAYRTIRSDEGAKVIELPLGYEGSHIPHAKNFYQSLHGKKVLEGAAQYAAGGWEGDDFAGNTFHAFLQKLSRYPLAKDPAFSKADLERVRAAGYRWLVVHGSFCREMHQERHREIYEEMNRVLRAALGPPASADEEITLYRL